MAEIGESLKEFLAVAGKTTIYLTLGPYAISTFSRKSFDALVEAQKAGYCRYSPLPEAAPFPTAIGVFSGVVIDLGQLIGYAYFAVNDHPEVLAIPVATNVLSKMYELGRSTYDRRSTYERARDRVADRAEERRGIDSRLIDSRRMLESSTGDYLPSGGRLKGGGRLIAGDPLSKY